METSSTSTVAEQVRPAHASSHAYAWELAHGSTEGEVMGVVSDLRISYKEQTSPREAFRRRNA